jgi:GNAT superfamily N-acetyltransferase
MLTFRKATPADLDLLGELMVEYYLFDAIPFEAGPLQKALALLLEQPRHGRAWLALESGEPVGYAVATYGFDAEMGGPLAMVTDFYLRPAWRGGGRGALLFESLAADLRAEGIGSVHLHVLGHNATAAAFWTKQGFERLDRVPFWKRL